MFGRQRPFTGMLPKPNRVDVEPHPERDGHREPDGEHPPRRLRERPDDDVPQPRERDDDDEEDGHRRDEAEEGPELLARDLGERSPPAPHRGDEDDEVLHGAAEDDAEEDPRVPGEEAELRRQHRADERPRARDGREVVAEEDPAVRGVVVGAVVALVRGRAARVVEAEDLRGDEGRVVAVGDREDGEGGEHPPQGAHGGEDSRKAASGGFLRAWRSERLSDRLPAYAAIRAKGETARHER